METEMIATTPTKRQPYDPTHQSGGPRFGGILWHIVRRTNALMLPFAGHRWNPIFAVVEHRGRRTGRRYATPVAARRVSGGFVISLSFGPQVDWYRNISADDGGAIHWKGRRYDIRAPKPIDAATGRTSFNVVQRVALRVCGIDAFIFVPDVAPDRR
jgi:deazaflavin-dependent oxidoreductase (nitroreductase family)